MSVESAKDVRDLLIAVAVCIDKAQLLRGEPTAISESRSGSTDLNGLTDDELAERIRELRARLKEGGDGRPN